MKLIDVYADVRAPVWLYELLLERTPEQSISHKQMPSEAEHMAFYFSRPYARWLLIEATPRDLHMTAQPGIVGAVYLTHQHEIGVGVLNEHRGNGYGEAAVKLLMHGSPGRFLANVNPQNLASVRMFTRLGFKHIQNTYAYE